MAFVLFAVGIVLTMAGFLTVGFGIPNKEFSFGSTLILAGTVSLCAGFLLIGVSFVVRELRRIARLLEGQGITAGPVKARSHPQDTQMQSTQMQSAQMQDTRFQDTRFQDARLQDARMQDVPEARLPPAPVEALGCH